MVVIKENRKKQEHEMMIDDDRIVFSTGSNNDCIKLEKKSRIKKRCSPTTTTTNSRVWLQGSMSSMCLVVWMATMMMMMMSIPTRESFMVSSAYVGKKTLASFSSMKQHTTTTFYSTATTRSEEETSSKMLSLPTLMTMKGTIDPRNVERQLQMYGKKDQFENVQSLYYSLYDKTQQPKLGVQVRPSTKLMNVAIAACSSSSVTTTLDIFHHGIQHHICPNVYTYGALLKSCAFSHNATMALTLLHDMEVRSSIHPSSLCLSLYIHTYIGTIFVSNS